MNHDLRQLCEQIDATVFSGDALEVGETLREFEEYVDRWKRNVDERIAYRAGYIDGRERRAHDLDEFDPKDHDAYRRGHAEGLAVPMLLTGDGKRSIFDDVDL